MDACNRKLVWDRPNQATAKQLGSKGAMCSFWPRHDSRPSGRWVNVEELNDAIKNAHDQGKGIGGAEQSIFDKLPNRRRGLHNLFHARSRALRYGSSSFLHHSTSSQPSSHSHTSVEATQSEPSANPEPEYDIDPITNKKVFRKPEDAFEGYRQQFQADPIREILKESETKPYKPYFAYEPDGKIPNAAEKEIGQPDLDSGEPYKPFFAYEPDGKIPGVVQESKVFDFDSGELYKPYFAYEPDGKIPGVLQEGSKNFNSGDQYEPYFAYEPDGRIPGASQEGSKDFDFDSGELYKPYFAYEPDGKIPGASQEGSKYFDFDSGELYKPYFAYEPDGKIPRVSEETSKDFDSGESYEPFFAHEPDGKSPNQLQDSLKEYETSVSYEPYFAYEPDGKLPSPLSVQDQDGLEEYETGVSYEPYFAYEPDGKIPESDAVTRSPAAQTAGDSCPVQKGLKDYDMKTSYSPVLYREPDGKLLEKSCPVQESLKAYDNITSYEPRAANDPANNFDPAKSASTGGLHDFCCRMTYGTKQKNKNSKSDNSSPTSPSTLKGQSDRKDDLDLLRPSDVRAASGILKGARKENKAEKLAKREELEKQYQQLTGDNGEYENIVSHPKVKITNDTGPKVDAWGYDKTPQGLELSYEQEVQKSEKRFVDGLMPADLFASNPDTPRIQTSLDRSTDKQRNGTDYASSDALQEVRAIRAKYAKPAHSGEEIKLQIETDPHSRKPQGLDTHYLAEKRLENDIDPYLKKPQGLETHFAEEQRSEKRLGHEVDSYSKVPQGLETHFEEEKRFENDKDPYSKRPQGLETSFAEECASQEAAPLIQQEVGRRNNLAENASRKKNQELVREIRSIYEDVYGKIDSQHRQVPNATTTSQSEAQGEPTMYTILTYDPATKSISTAETSSIVPNFARPLAPSEALLQLSNPAKFLPHFASLKAEGYEIASGNGDILIWRKVRPSSPTPHPAHTKAMDPIDGTQISPTAATGSPTGFVNHDSPTTDPDHSFKSNVDVQREEDVSSGRSNWADGTKKSRRKRGTGRKMLLGAAWLGGLSYTLGVVAEYFKTGGADGVGPQGF